MHFSAGTSSTESPLASHRMNQHLDHVRQQGIGDTRSEVVSLRVRKGSQVASGFVESGLMISTKSVVVASSKALADCVAAGLRRAGHPVEAAVFAEDLGVSSASGHRRSVGSLKKRLARGLARSQRVKRLVAVNPRAARLYQTGVRPQQSYGACISGVAPGQLQSMRQAAAQSVRSAGVQPCTATLLAWRLGHGKDPAAAASRRELGIVCANVWHPCHDIWAGSCWSIKLHVFAAAARCCQSLSRTGWRQRFESELVD